ncbi:MAG TPA: hypothetical protein PK006_04790 [Saprospiraceae bacterium]|nr:hypothetical protein [Saprospiraceae bacterium]
MKIIAYPIQDLTIARYLASQEVYAFCVNLDQRDQDQNLQFISQIRLWTTGPKILVYSAQLEKCQSFISDQLAYGYIFPAEPSFQSINIDGETEFLSSNNSILVKDWNNILISSELQYIIIQITGEQTVGIYDFDELDQLFENIQTSLKEDL